MNFEFTEQGWKEYTYWIETDLEVITRIKLPIKEIRRTPFQGLGKPEPLKFDLKGLWSRRITQEHRLVYKINGARDIDQKCTFLQCRFH